MSSTPRECRLTTAASDACMAIACPSPVASSHLQPATVIRLLHDQNRPSPLCVTLPLVSVHLRLPTCPQVAALGLPVHTRQRDAPRQHPILELGQRHARGEPDAGGAAPGGHDGQWAAAGRDERLLSGKREGRVRGALRRRLVRPRQRLMCAAREIQAAHEPAQANAVDRSPISRSCSLPRRVSPRTQAKAHVTLPPRPRARMSWTYSSPSSSPGSSGGRSTPRTTIGTPPATAWLSGGRRCQASQASAP